MAIDTDFYLANKLEKDCCFNVFNPLEIAFTHGKGVYLYDTEGRKYVDMIGGIAVNSLGHANKALTKTIAEQSKKLIHCCNYYVIPQRADLAFRLCNLSFADKCFFCNSGAEANEAAIKLARGYFYHNGSPRRDIITAKMSFHGRTLGTINATGQEIFRKPFGPDCPGFDYVEFNNIDALKEKITPNTAAVMLELIQGESGVTPANKEYIQAVRKLCTDNDIILIIDEVQTGIGRTGRMFCYENYGITPDIMTLAKGLGGGVPIGAMLSTNKFASGFEVGDHGSTFGGNPLCCACGNTVLDEIVSKDILANVNEVSNALFARLTAMQKKYPVIREVRGKGLLIGIEFAELIGAKELKLSLLNEGFLVSSIGSSVIRIAPPLIISKYEAMKFCSALEGILKTKVKIK